MVQKDIVLHIASEQPETSRQLASKLAALGFDARIRTAEHECLGAIPPSDILVVAGDRGERKPGRLPDLPTLCDRCRPQTIVFMTNMQPADFASFTRAGFRFINTSPTASVENLIYLVSQMDPEIVYRASKRRAMRADMSAAIETGVVSFFKNLRDNKAAAAMEEADRQRREMSDLLGMTPMSVWLDLFQNYHDGTAQHCSLVSSVTLAFARKLGLGEQDVSRLFDAAFFHDVGKAMIPIEILDKPGSLMPVEREIMNRHVIYGHAILSRHERTQGEIARVARDHHEYLDGSGYPSGLEAADIDDPTRILTISDIFAALVEKRSYKTAKTPEEAYHIIHKMAGTKLDPDLVRIFESVVADYDLAASRSAPANGDRSAA